MNLLFLNDLLEHYKTFIHIAEFSENFDQLDKTVDKYSNIYNNLIKKESVDVDVSIYIQFDIENSDTDLKFSVDDQLIISKYNNIFANTYIQY